MKRLCWASFGARGFPRRPRRDSQLYHHRSRPATALLLLVLFLAPAVAQSQGFVTINGIVLDSVLREPVAGVVVTALPDGKSVLSGGDGRFQLAGLIPGQVSLKVESAFYGARNLRPILLREGEHREFTVYLHSRTLTSNPQTVTASRIELAGTTSLRVSAYDRDHSQKVGDFLRTNGFHLESDGRTQYASLRGFSPQAVLVLADGIPLNPDGAAVDLAAISTRSVERIDVYESGAASRFGANALGGAINIISRKDAASQPSVSLSASQGSHSVRSGGSSAELHDLFNFEAVLDYSYEQGTNDYAYEHPYEGELDRRNNQSRLYSGYLSVRPSRLRALSLQSRISNTHQGIPGAVFQETPDAAARKRTSQHSLVFSTRNVDVTASFVELRQAYRDPDAFISYDKDYLQNARQLHGEFRQSLPFSADASVGADYVSESFFNDDHISPSRSLPTVSRKTEAVYVSFRHTRDLGRVELRSESRLRVDRIGDENESSPFLSLRIQLELPVTLGGEVSYSESFRLPPIDALFWRGDVFTEANPELRPERAVSRDAKIRAGYTGVVEAEIQHTWFESDNSDLITWRRQFDGKYKPINIDQSRYSGKEVSASVALRNHALELSYHRQSLQAINLSLSGGYYGQTVPFKPDRVERFSLTADLGLIRFGYAYSFTGVRQIREANTKQLNAFALHDLSVELPVSLFSMRHFIKAAVFNLADVRYELLERMPMPGRQYSLTISLQLFG